ncbi:hypothetical protein EUTSA_v10005904mg [Eutrema salsugineum]|uniref:F-box domain-containing protein n=1 Tax=Eutrema salsugineum TaxID=72664 RepID=V4LW96_EUTSA|nr:F-box/LRR-repeat protein At4g14103 [Eutrema salsugineum]ESQ44168.1 hypothetical protein EUTSA_v10005904mg [Eutrema salsugineum]
MVSKKMDFGGSRDVISGLPEALICHILSFLTTKEAASTSVLSSKWRYLFASVPNLNFDDSVYLDPRIQRRVHQQGLNVSPSFMDFVDRVLALQGNSHVHKFSLKIQAGNDPVDPTRIFRWILSVLARGVSDLDLCIDLGTKSLLPSEVFKSETLVRLKLDIGCGPYVDVGDVYLPKLKALHLECSFENRECGLTKLLSGCLMLEDLVLHTTNWFSLGFTSVSVTTLKRLTYSWELRDYNPESVSFDTPNLVYLEFTDTISEVYPKVNFESLVEARIYLRMSVDQAAATQFLQEASFSELQIYYSEGNQENKMVGNATDFIMGLRNVKILYLSADTLEVLTYCCEVIPLFNNLTQLTIESKPEVGWQSLPGLLKNSPNLETLVLQGLVHKVTDKCGEVCVCNGEEEDAITTCLSSSPVKVLKIMKFGEIYDGKIEKHLRHRLLNNKTQRKIEKQIEQVEYFLELMPNLEQVILYYGTSFEEYVTEVSTQLQRLPRVASLKCNVQLISDHSN